MYIRKSRNEDADIMQILDDIKKSMLMFLRRFCLFCFLVIFLLETHVILYLLQNNLGSEGINGGINETNLIIILIIIKSE